MPPKRSRSFSRTLSNTSQSSSSSKLRQNKLDFSFHSVPPSTSTSRPLSFTPSFGIPAARLDKGKHKQEPAAAALGTRDQQHDDDDDDGGTSSLWCERLAPEAGGQLAVHPSKVEQVQKWLSEAFSHDRLAVVKHRKVLALTGPAGAGKSATIRALSSATELDYDLVEWQNDLGSASFDNSTAFTGGSSFIERFTDFLQKAAKFPTLDLHNEIDHASSSSSLSRDQPIAAKRNRLILVQDLPNLHHAPTKQQFQAAIQQYLEQSSLLTGRGLPNVPIVLIVTESTPREDQDSWVGASSSNSWRERIASIMDTRTALGPSIRQNPAYTEVRFNPVAPTIILKGLKRAVQLAPNSIAGPSSKTATMSKPLLELLQAVAEDANGDLRAALNSLHFVGANSHQFQTIYGASSKAKQNGAGAGAKETAKALRKLLPLVCGRESSLVLFHALGRVLYNRREGDPGDLGARANSSRDDEDNHASDSRDDDDDDDAALKRRVKAAMQSVIPPFADDTFSSLPDHMAHLARAPSRVNVDSLWADLPVDSSVFQLYLHQNFAQFTGEIEQCEAILDAFSAADALAPLQEQYRYGSLLAYYSFLISVRGTLLGLPSPVERKAQKLGRATYWDVQKKLRIMLENVADATASMGGGPAGKMLTAGSFEGEAGSRFKRVKFSNPILFDTPDSADRTDAGLGDEGYSSLMRNNAAILVTEVLPLLAKIQQVGADSKMYELARMRFEYAGVADMALRVMDEHETGVNDAEQDDRAVLQSQKVRKRKAEDEQAKAKAETEEKMYLSEDDIADF